MQFVIVSSSLGRVHGYVRRGEAVKLDLLLRSVHYVMELWFLSEPRNHRKNVRPYWTLIWQRRPISLDIDYDTKSVRDLNHF
jgi:hypothetical protein